MRNRTGLPRFCQPADMRRKFLAAAASLFLGAALLGAAPASAVTLRFASQTDIKSLDPYTTNQTSINAHLSHVYEGLTARGKDLAIEPSLAERWEVLDGAKRWRFYLRRGVKFHGGEDFTADDVVFSAERVRGPTSGFRTRLPATAKVIKIDDYTVDFVLDGPNPILNAQWDTWFIMSKKWAEANNATVATPVSAAGPTYASLHANGTGPFMIESHEPGLKTVMKVNPAWWHKREHNIDEIVFTPISNAATRVAALLSGEADIIEPVPVQDIPRVQGSTNARVLAATELRTIFIGYDQFRDELLESNVKGRNPFKDVRVRQAFNMAIDKEAIRSRIMRGFSRPSPLMIAPQLFRLAGDFKNPPYDPDAAKKLLADAGYPDGFELGFDCPNDRYVNDAQICQAVVGMLSRIGVKVSLNAQPMAKYAAKVGRTNGFKTSMYLLGWTPPTLDSHNILFQLHGCIAPGSPRGDTNNGGYCNKEVDALTDKILVEPDPATRDKLIKQAFEITTREFAYLPLHQQSMSWGVALNLEVPQRADNSVMLYWAHKK